MRREVEGVEARTGRGRMGFTVRERGRGRGERKERGGLTAMDSGAKAMAMGWRRGSDSGARGDSLRGFDFGMDDVDQMGDMMG